MVADFLRRRQRAQTAPSSSGADKKSFKDYVTAAIKDKKMSKADFNKAMDAHLPKKATKEDRIASGDKVLKFLGSKGVKVES